MKQSLSKTSSAQSFFEGSTWKNIILLCSCLQCGCIWYQRLRSHKYNEFKPVNEITGMTMSLTIYIRQFISICNNIPQKLSAKNNFVVMTNTSQNEFNCFRLRFDYAFQLNANCKDCIWLVWILEQMPQQIVRKFKSWLYLRVIPDIQFKRTYGWNYLTTCLTKQSVAIFKEKPFGTV